MEEERKKLVTIKVSEHVLLKELELSDAIDIFNTIDSQREYLGKWLSFVEYTKTVDDSTEFIETLDCPCNANSGQVFAIRYDGKFVGLIGTKNYDPMCNGIEIGYWLSENYQKKGIVTQSMKAVLYAVYNHSTVAINRVVVKCAVGNTPSSNIPKRLNFTLEGVERDGEVFSDGAYKDIEVYSLLKREFVKE